MLLDKGSKGQDPSRSQPFENIDSWGGTIATMDDKADNSSLPGLYKNPSSSIGDIVNCYLTTMYSPVDNDVPRLASPVASSADSSTAKSLDGLLDALAATIFELEHEDDTPEQLSSPYTPPPTPQLGPAQLMYSVGSLLQHPNATCGFLNKLSLSRATGERQWKSRFFVLNDSSLYLFRSDIPAELPITFLPVTVTNQVSSDGLPSNHEDGSFSSGWVLEVRGIGYTPDGSIVERVWLLQHHDESNLFEWFNRLVPIAMRRRGSLPDTMAPKHEAIRHITWKNVRGPRRESVGSSRLQQLDSADTGPMPSQLMLRRPSDAMYAQGVSVYNVPATVSPSVSGPLSVFRSQASHGYPTIDTSPVPVGVSYPVSPHPSWNTRKHGRPNLVIQPYAQSGPGSVFSQESTLNTAVPSIEVTKDDPVDFSSDMILMGGASPRRPSMQRDSPQPYPPTPRNEWPSEGPLKRGLFSESESQFMSRGFSMRRRGSAPEVHEPSSMPENNGGGLMMKLLGRSRSVKK
ncbi:hypothetical protein BC829DRAFT_106671 [Chytridium lagenaria]|nr:hypothetical protein BC829DRAFT_106671 [Chytridium lagenaria]